MSNSGSESPGSTDSDSSGSAMNASARVMTMRIVAAVLAASPRSWARSAARSLGAGARAGSPRPARRCRAPTGRPCACPRRPARRRGTATRRWLEAVEVQKLPSSVPSVLTALAKPSARRMAVARSRQPSIGFHRKVDGTPPMPCGLNTSTGPTRRPDAGGQLEHVVLGRGRHDRPGIVHDHPGQPAGLAGPRRGHDQRVLFERDAQRVPPLGPAQQDRMSPRVEQPLSGGQRPARPAGPAERREPAPAQPQLEERGVAAARPQPQVQPDPHAPGAVAGESAAADPALRAEVPVGQQ